MRSLILGVLLTLSAAIFAQTPQLYDPQTGKFLGNLSANPYDPNSTSNPYGPYGSRYNPKSATNPYAVGTTPEVRAPSTFSWETFDWE